MERRKDTEKIRRILAGIEADRAKGLMVRQACSKAGISDKSYYRWRAMYAKGKSDAMTMSPKIKELKAENVRLKKLVVDLSIEAQILRDVAKKKW